MNTKEKRQKELDSSWVAWLNENLERKCDAQELVDILKKNGFAIESIRKHMGTAFPFAMLGEYFKPNYWAIANVRLTRSPLVKRIPTNKAQIYTYEGFLTEAECDRIIELSAEALRPSTVTTGDVKYRTSSTSELTELNHPDVDALDEKISNALGISRSYSEAIQAQRYEVGQEFRKHTDYFQPKTQEFVEYAGRAGQRTWTFMVYLNDGMTGGGTNFIELDTIFTPKKGMAVIWNNLLPDGSPNPSTLHAGMPVESGHKIIITKWFRDRGFGQMFR